MSGHRARDERGQTLVELAFSLVFLLVLLSVVADLGRVFFTYVALRDASQEGAAYASLDPNSSGAIEAHVRQSSNSPIDLSDTTKVQVTVTPIGGTCTGNEIEVAVSYSSFPLIMPFTSIFIGSPTITLTAEAIDTILQSPC
jgi:Flp pilus assembly protein TadG